MKTGQTTEKTIVFTPDKVVRQGFWIGGKEMFVNLIQSRELIRRLFLRDFNLGIVNLCPDVHVSKIM